jgi:hypothetical protein
MPNRNNAIGGGGLRYVVDGLGLGASHLVGGPAFDDRINRAHSPEGSMVAARNIVTNTFRTGTLGV